MDRTLKAAWQVVGRNAVWRWSIRGGWGAMNCGGDSSPP